VGHIKHIQKLHVHRNVLYSLIVVLVVIQIIAFFVISSKITQLINQQRILSNLQAQSLNDLRTETQYKVTEITRVLAQQRHDFTGQIEQLRTSQGDFSEVVTAVIKGVVSVGTDSTAGTGFAVNPLGYILTNEHVVRNARFIQVQTYDGNVYPAELLGVDATLDIAVLRLNVSLNSLELAETNSVTSGEKVIAIGNPLGLSFSVTEGIVSAVHRRGPNGLEAYIQTDVTLNPGNSGGPLINKQGKVVGINNFKIGDAEGLGFALESDKVRLAVEQIVANATRMYA
jgi:S1-C subfamily serine protease